MSARNRQFQSANRRPTRAAMVVLAAWLGIVAMPGMLRAATEAGAESAPFIIGADCDPFEALQDPFEDLVQTKFNEAVLSEAESVAAAPLVVRQTALSQEQALPLPLNGAKVNSDGSTNADWMPKPLGMLTTNVDLPSGLLPRDYSSNRPQAMPLVDECGATRGWPLSAYNWQASCFAHNPLYFEEINLERYGYGCCDCLQSAASACHFFATVPALPYEMAADCPWECDYTLGHYRPGSCPPRRYHCCAPISGLGSVSEAGVLTGMIFLIP